MDTRANIHRAADIRRVIEDCMARRESGEPLTDAQVIAAHPELMPELERELRILAIVQEAVRSSRTRVSATPPPASDISTRTQRLVDDGILGVHIDGYQVLRRIHSGAQGMVFEGLQSATRRRVAIKVRRDGFYGDPALHDRFKREVEILALLDHANIVSIIDSGIGRGQFYYIMDFVEGQTLDRYLENTRLSIDQTLRLFEKIASTVNAAHLRGVIHRDLKPANILVDSYGEPRLLDFGLARLTRDSPARAAAGSSGHLTQTGQFVGSLPWTSPEQADGVAARIDLRTDVYSLGVILFQMLTGKLPYEVETDVASAARTIGEAQVPHASKLRKGIPADVDAIIFKCVQKEPSARYQIAGEVAADIIRCIERKPLLAEPDEWWPRTMSLLRRHKALVAINLGVILALTAAVIWLSIQLLSRQ